MIHLVLMLNTFPEHPFYNINVNINVVTPIKRVYCEEEFTFIFHYF